MISRHGLMVMNGKKTMSWIKTERGKNLSVLFVSLIISLSTLEIFLRFYNPFGFRIKGDKILLYPHKRYIIENSKLRGVDRTIIHTKNSLGLRGSQPPKDFNSALTIVAVGGSTTEGFYLSDTKTWPELLEKKLKKDFPSIWINNAGFDGQSSWGHLIFVKDYLSKLKPKVAIFYCGLNDIGLSAMNSYDKNFYGQEENKVKRAVKFLSRHLETLSCIVNLYLYFSYKKTGITHGNLDLKDSKTTLPAKQESDKILQLETENAKLYAQRLSALVKESRKYDIEPVFISQAALCRKAVDKTSKIDIGNIKLNNKFLNCQVFGEALALYNKTMAEIAKKENVFFIDAEKLIPVDSSLYYDLFHFNNKGSEFFAEKISKSIGEFLKNRYNK